MKNIRIRRHNITLSPDYDRVIIRSFIPGKADIIRRIIDRVLNLSEEAVKQQMDSVRLDFSGRHYDIELLLQGPFVKVRHHIAAPHLLSRERQLLIGALFAAEYSLESAALFNPSIVLHPDQSGAPKGGLRFIISLRATGEGHISSIEFRAGTITKNGSIQLDPFRAT